MHVVDRSALVSLAFADALSNKSSKSLEGSSCCLRSARVQSSTHVVASKVLECNEDRPASKILPHKLQVCSTAMVETDVVSTFLAIIDKT